MLEKENRVAAAGQHVQDLSYITGGNIRKYI